MDMDSTSTDSKARRFVRWTALVVLVIWGGFWLLFALGHLVPGHEGRHTPSTRDLVAIFAFSAPILALVAVPFFFTRVGGALLIAAAAYSVWFYNNLGAWVLLSLPAAIVGLTLLVVGGGGLRFGHGRVEPAG